MRGPAAFTEGGRAGAGPARGALSAAAWRAALRGSAAVGGRR